MKSRWNLKLQFANAGLVTVLSIAGTAAAATVSKEGSFQGMTCYTGPAHVAAEVKGHVGISYDLIGTQIRKEGELGYLGSAHCVGSAMIIGNDRSDQGSCVDTDPDGDHIFLVYSSSMGNQPVGTWKAVAGDGKYAGIEASGTYANDVRPVKPVRADTTQVCNKEAGSWKLK